MSYLAVSLGGEHPPSKLFEVLAMLEQKTRSPGSALKTIVQNQKKQLEQQEKQEEEKIQPKEQPQPPPRPRQELPPPQEERGKSDLEHAASANERSDAIRPDTCPSSSGKKIAKDIIMKADQEVSSSATTTAAAAKNEPSDAGLAHTCPSSGKKTAKDIIKADQVSSSAAAATAAAAKNDRSDAVLPETCPSISGNKTVKDIIKADQIFSSATSTASAKPSDDVLPDTCPSDSGRKAVQDIIEAEQAVSSLAKSTAAAGQARTWPSGKEKKSATGIIKADHVVSAGLAHTCPSSGKETIKGIIKADQVVSSSVTATTATATASTSTSRLMSEEQQASPTLLERENGQPAAANHEGGNIQPASAKQEYEREQAPSAQDCGNKLPLPEQCTLANSSSLHVIERIAAVVLPFGENANHTDVDITSREALKQIAAIVKEARIGQPPGRFLHQPQCDSHQFTTTAATTANEAYAVEATTSSHVLLPPPMVLSASEQAVSSELTPTIGQKRVSDSNSTESIPRKKQMSQPVSDTAVSKSNEEWPLDWHDLPGGNADDDDFSFTNQDEKEFLLAIERRIEHGSGLQRSQSQTGFTIARTVVVPAIKNSAKPTVGLQSISKASNPKIGADMRQLQPTKKNSGSKKAYVFTNKTNRETAWVNDMYKWMLTVEHGPGNNTCSETNARNVRARVLELAQGKGVRYKRWKKNVFKKGVKVDLSSDILTMQKEAKAFEKRHGEDVGHGWVIRHPLKKLQLYKEYKKRRGGR